LPAVPALGAMPSVKLIVPSALRRSRGMAARDPRPRSEPASTALGMALRKRFCRSFNFEMQAAATDNGIVISLGGAQVVTLEIGL